MKCPFCKAKRKDNISYECGTLDNDQHPRTYNCALTAWYLLKEKSKERDPITCYPRPNFIEE